MKSIQQLFWGLIAAAGTSLLVLGAFSQSLIEGGPLVITNTPEPVPSATLAFGETPAPTLTPSQTLTPVQPTPCPIPDGWLPYVIQTGDTLEALAEQAGKKGARLPRP